MPVLLYRAVSAAELTDILGSDEYRLVPGGVEGKYFCLSQDDARYFRDQGLLDAMAIVYSFISETTEALLDHGVFDQRAGLFVNFRTLPLLNSDAKRLGGIRRLE